MTSLSKRNSSILTVAVVLLVIGLGAWMWYLQPEKATKWAISMFFLPAAWSVILLLRRKGGDRWASEDAQARLRWAIMSAGLILASALSVVTASTLGLLEGSVSERSVGVVLGVALMIYGNALPKQPAPWTATKCESPGSQPLRRFAGWTFALTGLAYSIVWLTLPVERASTVAMLICAAGVLLVAARVIPSVIRRRRVGPPAQS